MTRGEAYKAYYEANRDRIVEANRQRAKQRRENPEEAQRMRRMRQTREAQNRASFYRETLLEIAERNPSLSVFYEYIAESSLLSAMTPSIARFLMRIHYASLTDGKVDGNRREKNNTRGDPSTCGDSRLAKDEEVRQEDETEVSDRP